jgi:hypothetical protein
MVRVCVILGRTNKAVNGIHFFCIPKVNAKYSASQQQLQKKRSLSIREEGGRAVDADVGVQYGNTGFYVKPLPLFFMRIENHGGVCCKPTDRRKIATVI